LTRLGVVDSLRVAPPRRDRRTRGFKAPRLINVASQLAATEILLTGGNGFLGKVLLALLLDRYPDFKKLHVVIRPRRGRSARERFEQDVLASPPLREIAERLGAEYLAAKIEVWEGDVGRPSCGIDPAVLADWRGRVGLVLNCAGLVEFFPPVDESLNANVDSAENLLALAKQIDAKLLHVSTCYVAGRADGLIEESEPIEGFYPLRRGPEDRSFDFREELKRVRERAAEIIANDPGRSRETQDRLTELGRRRAERWGWVNTYTYAKSLGEQLIAAESEVDAAIVRPAIVESALRFPFPGWIEGGRTAAPLVLMALGGTTEWPARADLSLEIVPVDLIAAAIWAVSGALLACDARPIYQLASSDVNPFEMQPLLELLLAAAGNSSSPRLDSAEEAQRRSERLRGRARKTQDLLAEAARKLDRIGLPGGKALAARAAALRTLGLRSRFRDEVLEQYLPFILENRYVFEASNMRETYSKLSPADREKLPWDPESIDWPRYWRENQIEGVRKWVQPETVREWSVQL